MKLKKTLIIAFVCILTLSGCQSTTQSDSVENTVQDENSAANEETSTQTTTDLSSTDGIDVDLTILSSTMVYAEVYNMMMTPEDYMGKTVRITGPYYSTYYDATDLDYHYVVISDATECCQNGIEFSINKESPVYPNDGEEVELTGTFSSYDELGVTYYYLEVDDVTVLTK